MKTRHNPAHNPAALPRPATGREIQIILGRQVDPDLLSGILHIGASSREILEACEWLNADDYIGGELQRTMSPRTRAIYELLQDDLDQHQEEPQA